MKIDMNDIKALKGAKLSNEDQYWYADGVSTDTRKPLNKMLFFAIRGERYDGHDFIKQAIASGAAGVVINRAHEHIMHEYGNSAFVVSVDDTVQSLGELAHIIRNRYKRTVVSITGSNGKTTTKEILYRFLSTTYKTGKNPGNLNNLIGVPLSILNMQNDTDIWILELGTSRYGELASLTGIASPDIGILTNIGRAHLEFFKDINGVAKAKSEMFMNMEQGRLAIVNADDPYALEIAKQYKGTVLTAGFSSDAYLRILSYEFTREGMNAEIMYEGEKRAFTTLLSGRHYLYDIALSMVCALHLRVTWEAIKSVCRELKAFEGRGNVTIHKNGIVVIDDTYNANPDSMISGFLSAMERYGQNKIVAVIGDMLELGEQTEEQHYRLGQFLAERGIGKFILIGRFSKNTMEGIKSVNRKDNVVKIVDGVNDAIKELLALSNDKVVIYVKGSRGMKLEQVVSMYNSIMEGSNA
ncbi:MAG: UDP-N-acetylmuramoyl-tripeptide--D-alanyl-D-alanine ligase [bacterium]